MIPARFSNPRLSLTERGNPMAVGKVSDADFEAEVLNAQGPVVVDFWAEWCGPCRMIAPALDEISGAMGDKVKIVKLNVDESPKTASKYGVMSIPTLMIFKGGEMGARRPLQTFCLAKSQNAAVDHSVRFSLALA